MAEQVNLLDTVKTALRIKNNGFDSEINNLIEACKIDLSRAGVTAKDYTDPFIVRAIILYAKANFGYDNPDSDKFQKSYDHLLCSMALAGDYTKTPNGGSNDE